MKKVPAVKDLILNIRELAEVYNDITGTDITNQIIEGTVLEYFPIPKNEIIDNNNQNESYFWSSDSSSDELDEYGFKYKNNEQLTNVYCDEGSKNNESELIKAIKTNDENLFDLIKLVDIKYQDDNGNSLLHHASLSNNRFVIECLLANKADINVLNKKGENPLSLIMGTIDFDNTESILDNANYLISHGAIILDNCQNIELLGS